jgi:hypothetical protein
MQFSPEFAGARNPAVTPFNNKMAANSNNRGNPVQALNLVHVGLKGDTERRSKFRNKSVVEMKFSVEKEWVRKVRSTKDKPNYGM